MSSLSPTHVSICCYGNDYPVTLVYTCDQVVQTQACCSVSGCEFMHLQCSYFVLAVDMRRSMHSHTGTRKGYWLRYNSPDGQMFFFLLLRRASSNLCNSFTIVFTQNSLRAVHQPIAFSQLWSLMRWFNLVTEELWLHCDTILFICTHAHKSLTNKTWLLLKLEIRLCLWRQGSLLSSVVDSVFEQSLVSNSSANTAYIYWGSLWGQTYCSVINGKLQLKHAQDYKTL